MSTGDLTPGEGRRVCLLTGAGGVLGDAFCQRYAGDYAVVAVCRNRAPGVPSQLESYVDPLDPGAEVPENAGSVFTIYADLTDPADVERVVEVTLARFGGVDLLVNNAAAKPGYAGSLLDGDAPLADLEHQLRVNVAAPLLLTVRLAQRFWMHRADDNRARNRNVVNVSSVSALQTFPHQGQAGYAASKAALNALTGHLAAELGTYGVRANAVVPTSFPQLVATEAVADAIVGLDRDTSTGGAVVLDGAARPVS